MKSLFFKRDLSNMFKTKYRLDHNNIPIHCYDIAFKYAGWRLMLKCAFANDDPETGKIILSHDRCLDERIVSRACLSNNTKWISLFQNYCSKSQLETFLSCYINAGSWQDIYALIKSFPILKTRRSWELVIYRSTDNAIRRKADLECEKCPKTILEKCIIV